MPIIKCGICGKEFFVNDSMLKRGRGKYCSIYCRSQSLRKENNIIIKDNHAEIIIKKEDKDLIILIDLDDVEKVKKFKWRCGKNNSNYYIRAWGRKEDRYQKIIYLHRYVMDCPKYMQVDHISHDTFDNRKQNLRICTSLENKQNVPGRNSISNHRNVHWNKRDKKWHVRMTINHKEIIIGYFKDLKEAVMARDEFIKNNNLIFKTNTGDSICQK